MTDIDLEAIRARDADWEDRQPLREGAGRDRRALLRYIDELESLAGEIATDLKIIKRTHLERYQAKPAPVTVPEIEALDRELSEERAGNGRKGLSDFLDSQASGKLLP